MADTYRVFSRKVWQRVNGKYVPYHGARKMTVQRGCSLERARELCALGPANEARDAGREYRGKTFFEFERE